MLDGRLVPDKYVRQRGRYEIGDHAKDPAKIISSQPRNKKKKNERQWEDDIPDDQEEAQELTVDVIPGPCAHVGILGWLEVNELCGRFVNEGLRRAKQGQAAVGGIGKARNRNRGRERDRQKR